MSIQFFDIFLVFIPEIVREAPNCAKKCEKRLVERICAGNGLKCEYVRETAKSAIPHPPHFIFASAAKPGTNVVWNVLP